MPDSHWGPLPGRSGLVTMTLEIGMASDHKVRYGSRLGESELPTTTKMIGKSVNRTSSRCLVHLTN